MRIALGVEYNGGQYRGWQAQEGEQTVQACLQQAITRVADHPVQVTCAGRTDAGVHALGQVVHFDTTAQRRSHGWRLGISSFLPPDIAVPWAQEVESDFDARFSASARHYRYVLINRRVRPGLWSGRAGWNWKPLAVEPMQAAAEHWLGEHDFSAFRSAQCQARHARRRLDRLSVRRRDDWVVFDVSANAFLHHMVRNLVGTLMLIGAGEHSPDWARDVLTARDRRLAGPTAEPGGLYLMAVDYPCDLPRPTTDWTVLP